MLTNNHDVFHNLSEAISEGIVIVNENQEIVALNSATELMFGYNKGELLNKQLSSLIPVNFHKNHTKYFKEFFKNGEKRSMGMDRVLHGVKKNDSVFPIEVGLNPMVVGDETFVMALVIDITKRVEIEKNLHVKSKALQHASNGIVITDALQKDHPIIYANEAFEKITGYSQEDILYKNCRFLQADDTDQKSINKIKNAISKGQMCHVILRNYRKDGTMFWNELSITPIKDNLGIITHFVGIQNDITKRKLAEENELHFASILDESLNEIYVFDSSSLKFLNANYGAVKNLGYSLDELKQMTPVDIKPEYTLDKFKNQVEDLLKKRVEKLEFETIHERKNGSTYPVEVHLQLSVFEDKEVFFAVILDITERKTQELFKIKQNHILELIVLDTSLEFILKDISYLIEEQFEDVYVSILLLNQEEKKLKSLVAPSLPESYGETINNILIGKDVDVSGMAIFLEKETMISHVETHELWENFKDLVLPYGIKASWTKPIMSSKNSILGVFAIFRKEDRAFSNINKQVVEVGVKLAGITIEKHLTNKYIEETQSQLESYAKDLQEQVEEQTLELKIALKKEIELNELKTKFLSLVSHEFKTPLSGILTSAMLLKKYTLADQQDKRNKHIDTITNIVNNLNNILNDFLSVENLESGKVTYHFKTFKLSKVLNEVIYNSNMLLKDGQKIKYPENIDDLSLHQDEKILELTLSNIVHNAIKYSSENGHIDIELSQNKHQTVFKIKDEGIGIPEADQKNIFNRYFRAENVLTIQGTGIGLNIVKNHLENLGGSLSFVSQEHVGSTFIITIPNKPI
ncbi:PAS domain S-box protein [Xanthomarina sp. F2636L]|uniref:PAS domain S-box protein n=1 Tax=Xanthomarina sp. F2636L TaxID=2996018 RepID=UPI002B1F31D1|nr:PAS domain S-box protein [Xanthomarina sp. F2636L]